MSETERRLAVLVQPNDKSPLEEWLRGWNAALPTEDEPETDEETT